MADHKMVTVNGVRYREEDAPKQPKADEGGEAEHKMRTPRKTARSSKSKQD